jgi:hypothetical protein
MRKAFTTCMRPILAYDSIVQPRYTERIPSLAHLSYLQRLAALNLEPLNRNDVFIRIPTSVVRKIYETFGLSLEGQNFIQMFSFSWR